jgi:hypothetical protein
MWLDYHGPSILEDVSNGLMCELNFEAASWKNAYLYQHKFSGVVRDADRKDRYKIEGDWSKYVDVVHLDSGERRRVWELEPEPLDRWGRTAYSAMMLAGPADAYPPTDIRRREDIQAMAAGDSAAALRARMTMQKPRSEQIDYEPRLFHQIGERYVLKTMHCRVGPCIDTLPSSGVMIRDRRGSWGRPGAHQKIDSILPSTEHPFPFPTQSSGTSPDAVKTLFKRSMETPASAAGAQTEAVFDSHTRSEVRAWLRVGACLFTSAYSHMVRPFRYEHIG